MKIYFAGSIRWWRDDQELYLQIIGHIATHGQVLTEHIGDKNLGSEGEITKTDTTIFERDVAWVEESDVVVAEVSTPSLWVGYELGRAEDMGKKILCLYRKQADKRLSAMIAGNSYMQILWYENFEEAKNGIDEFFEKLK